MSRSGSRPERRIIASAKLDDANGLAHLEHEHLAACLAQRPGPDHQLDRLGDRHEVARHARIGDGHGPAGRDLAAEDRDHRTGRARARCRSARSRRRCSDNAPAAASTRPLRERLGRAHHGRRVDGLVGGDEHEPADPQLAGDRGRPRGWQVRCCEPPRPGWPRSSSRACRRRRGRRPRAGRWRRPPGSAPPPCSRRARRARSARAGPPRARAGSRTGCPRRGRPAPAAAGPTRAIWRQSSAPIEPPAPVTSTTCSLQVRAHALELHAHRLAAEHVLDLNLAQLPGDRGLAGAVAQQLEHGRHRPHRDAALAAGGHHPSAQRAGADGIAITTSSGSTSSSTRARSPASVVPSTRRPYSSLHAQLARIVVDEADRAAGAAAGCEPARAPPGGRPRRLR